MNPKLGGVQRVSDTLARYLNSKGHELYYLTLFQIDGDDYGYPAHLYKLPSTNLHSRENYEFYWNFLVDKGIDVVVNHDASNKRSKFFLRTKRIPVKRVSLYHAYPLNGLHRISEFSGTIRRILSLYLPKLIHYWKIQKKRAEINFLLDNSDSLVLLSEAFKNEIQSELGITSEKICAIPNPNVPLKSIESSPKRNQILYVGRIIISQKRPDKLLPIWEKLHKDFCDWELLFLGEGPARAALEEKAKTMGLNNVSFLGNVDPIPYYRDASIICMTSDYEGFGLVLVEAMRFRVVPIAFNNWPSLSEIIVDKETGVLVSTNDLDDYASKLRELFVNHQARAKMSKNAQRHVTKYEIDLVGPHWDKLLIDLMTTSDIEQVEVSK